jgi:hypothetical protein
MVVLGLILVAVAVLLAAGVAASSGENATLDVFGLGVDTSSSVVFFAGVVTTVALVAGLWMVKKGLARGYRRRKEVRELRQQVQETPAPATLAAVPETDAEGNERSEAEGRHRASDDDTAETAPEGDEDRLATSDDLAKASATPATPAGSGEEPAGRDPVGDQRTVERPDRTVKE